MILLCFKHYIEDLSNTIYVVSNTVYGSRLFMADVLRTVASGISVFNSPLNFLLV